MIIPTAIYLKSTLNGGFIFLKQDNFVKKHFKRKSLPDGSYKNGSRICSHSTKLSAGRG